MLKLLFWVVLIGIAIYYWRRKNPATEPVRPQNRPITTDIPMVRCAHCGVHLPKDRALSRGADWYCTPAHLEQGPTAP